VQESLENSRKDISAALMKTLPKLLRKYLADKEKVPYILELTMSMNLEEYNLRHQEQVKCKVTSIVLF
jgi:hypothetical protein